MNDDASTPGPVGSPVDKATAYANALDSDISAQPWQQVRDGKLWRGYVGTIYGCPVATDNGATFDSRADALENARLYREQCREIRREVGLKPRWELVSG